MPDRPTKQRREEIGRELCNPNEYFIYQCVDKDRHRKVVADLRRRSGPEAPTTTPAVPLSQVKADLADLRHISRDGPKAHKQKLADAEKERTAQTASDKIAASISTLRPPKSAHSKKSISQRIDDALKDEGLRGVERSRARSLTASKASRALGRIFA